MTKEPTIFRDEFWGYVLIALGIAAIIFKPFDKIDAKLKGAPDQFLTLLLIALGIVAIVIAFRGSPSLKALAAVWIVTP